MTPDATLRRHTSPADEFRRIAGPTGPTSQAPPQQAPQAHQQAPEQAPPQAPQGHTAEGPAGQQWGQQAPVGASSSGLSNNLTERGTNAGDIERVGARTQLRPFTCESDLQQAPQTGISPYCLKSAEDHRRNGRIGGLSQADIWAYFGGSHSRGSYRRLSRATMQAPQGRGPYYSPMRRRRQQAVTRRETPVRGGGNPHRRGANRNPKRRYQSTRIPSPESAIPKIQNLRGSGGVSPVPPANTREQSSEPTPHPTNEPAQPPMVRVSRRGWYHG